MYHVVVFSFFFCVIRRSASVKNRVFCPVKISFTFPFYVSGLIMQNQFEFEFWILSEYFFTWKSGLLMWNNFKCSWNIFHPWLRVFGLMMAVCNLSRLLSLGNCFQLVSNLLTLNIVGLFMDVSNLKTFLLQSVVPQLKKLYRQELFLVLLNF